MSNIRSFQQQLYQRSILPQVSNIQSIITEPHLQPLIPNHSSVVASYTNTDYSHLFFPIPNQYTITPQLPPSQSHTLLCKSSSLIPYNTTSSDQLIHAISAFSEWNAQPHLITARIKQLSFLLDKALPSLSISPCVKPLDVCTETSHQSRPKAPVYSRLSSNAGRRYFSHRYFKMEQTNIDPNLNPPSQDQTQLFSIDLKGDEPVSRALPIPDQTLLKTQSQQIMHEDGELSIEIDKAIPIQDGLLSGRTESRKRKLEEINSSGETTVSSVVQNGILFNDRTAIHAEKNVADYGALTDAKRRRTLLEKIEKLDVGPDSKIDENETIAKAPTNLVLVPVGAECDEVIDIVSTSSSNSSRSNSEHDITLVSREFRNDHKMNIRNLGETTDQVERTDNQDYWKHEEEDGATSPIRMVELVCSVANSVKALKPEDIERELLWSLWELQEVLGEQFPACLKPIRSVFLSTTLGQQKS